MTETTDQQSPAQVSQPILTYNVRLACLVLQHLQVLFGTEPTILHDPRLSDLGDLLHFLQEIFGQDASVEQVIQALVAKDMKRQLAHRDHSLDAVERCLCCGNPQHEGACSLREDGVKTNALLPGQIWEEARGYNEENTYLQCMKVQWGF